LTEHRQRWLAQLDDDSSPLLAALGSKPPRRLGLYFEALWQFFLTQDPQTELLAHNLAVRDNGRTLGEFDCLYYCREKDQIFHLELAVKYFLGYGDSQSGTQQTLWYGPNSRDRLDLKLSHMLDRQIRLGEHPQAQTALAELDIQTYEKEVAMHGYLFNSHNESLPSPEGHNPAATGGVWIPENQLAGLVGDSDAEQFLVLPRLRWLSPAVATAGDKVYSGKQLTTHMAAHFTDTSRPQLIAALNDQGTEQQRFFVTWNQWPDMPDA
jgi:hypothetical protein